MRHASARSLLAALAVVTGGATARPAGDRVKLRCVEAHEAAQVTRRDGHLRASRKDLAVCTDAACPAVIQKECAAWLAELDAMQPTVIASVRDERGVDVVAVRVLLDGELVAERLDGRPLEVDPGEHTLRFELPSGRSIDQRLVLREGETGRVVSVNAAPVPAPPIAPPVAAPAAPATGGSSPANTSVGLVVGALGLAALGGAVALTIAQNSEASKALSACATGCVADTAAADQAESEVNLAKTERVFEGVSYGVAGVALAVGAYFLVARPIGVTVDASPRGASVLWRATF